MSSNKKYRVGIVLGLTVAIISVLVLPYFVDIQPINALGGAVWSKNGLHYMSGEEIAARVQKLNTPKEVQLVKEISKSTASCDSVQDGFCQRNPGEYVNKSLVTAAVAYVPGTPDTKEVVGFCTECNDGTMSPSCAVGRGACSWHGGVAAYNVPEYRITPGTPAIQAQPAVYSYVAKTYKDSTAYITPDPPSLAIVVQY